MPSRGTLDCTALVGEEVVLCLLFQKGTFESMPQTLKSEFLNESYAYLSPLLVFVLQPA